MIFNKVKKINIFNEFKKQGFLMNLSLGDCNMIKNDELINLSEAGSEKKI